MRWLFLVPAVILLLFSFVTIDSGQRSQYREKSMLMFSKENRVEIAKYLRDYNSTHGHYPTNDEGLMVVQPLITACKDYRNHLADGPPTYWGFIKSGLFSPFGDQFIYENRRGFPKKAFADSGANQDPERAFSIRVDKDIYVWSIGTKQAALSYKINRRNYLITVIIGLVLGSGFLIIYFVCLFHANNRLNRTSKAFVYLFVDMLAIAIGLLIVFLPCITKTCYATAYRRRLPPSHELTQQYIAVMKKYKDRGVISDKAYNKILSAVKEDKLIR